MNESQVLGRRHLDKKGQPEQSGPDPASLECCVITDNGEIRYITSRSSSIVLQWRRPHDENSFSSTIYRTHALTHPPHLSFSELGEHPASWEPAQRFFGPSASIYKWLGIDQWESFPDDVVHAVHEVCNCHIF